MNETNRIRSRQGYKLDRTGIILLGGFIILAIITAIVAFNVIHNLVSGWSMTSLPGAPSTTNGTGTNNSSSGGNTVLQPAGGGPAPKAWDGKSRINILFFGLDYRKCDTYFANSATGCDPTGVARSDSMILFTVDPVNQTAGMLSIPRDLWVDIPGGFGFNKINTAYQSGEAFKAPDGPTLAMQTVQNFLGVPIQYYVRIDFEAFIKMIDEIGGIVITPDMDIDLKDTSNILSYFENAATGETVSNYVDSKTHRNVTDYEQCLNCKEVMVQAGKDPGVCPQQPISNAVTCKVISGEQILSLKNGETYTLNGDQALAYARNRHIEGEDFARSSHQQQVIMAILNRVRSSSMLPTLMSKAPALYNELSSGIHTNLTLDQALQLAVLVLNIPQDKIVKTGITESQVIPSTTQIMNSGQLVNVSVLIPIPEEIRIVRDSIFTDGGTTNPMAGNLDQSAKLQGEAARVQIVNGSNTSGLAEKTQTYLAAQGVNVTQIGNASYMANCEIDVFNPKPYTLSYLANLFGVSTSNIISKYDPSASADIVVVLGDSWANNNPMP